MQARLVAALTSGLVAVAVCAATSPAGAVPITSGGDAVAANAPVSVAVTLTGADQQGLDAYAAAVSTPGHAAYRRHLTRDQVRARFGAPADRVQRVTAWARRSGFAVAGLDPTGARLTLTGPARAVRAFGVEMTTTVRDGVRVRVASAVPHVPAEIGLDVQAVSGLSQQVARPTLARPAGMTIPAADSQFCARYWAEQNNGGVPQKYPAGKQSNPICGYTGPQLRALYGLADTDRGQGQTIVVVGAFDSPTVLADANAAFAHNGVPLLRPEQYVTKKYAPAGDPQGCPVDVWHAEQALDVQAAHTIAPDAMIVYAAAPDCRSLEDTVAHVVGDTSITPTIISESWGLLGEPDDSGYVTSINNLMARATVLGIGNYFSSGDWGDNSGEAGQSGPSVLFPASSPWVTAVGGTTSAIGAGNRVLWQTGWSGAGNALSAGGWQRLTPPFVAGAGGGPSHLFDKPTWQTQAGVAGSKRSVPDLAALADSYTGFYVAYTSGGGLVQGPFGGTSLAAPIVASLVAVAQGRAGAGTDVGLLTPTLYAQAAAGKAVVTDVRHVAAGVWTPAVSANTPRGDYLIDVDADVQTLMTGTGYDTVTGLGAPGPAFLSEIVS